MLIAPMLSHERGVGAVAEIPNHEEPTSISGPQQLALNSASTLERETAICFLVFKAIEE